MSNFWQEYRPATIDIEHNYVRLRRAKQVGKLNNLIRLPLFNIPTPLWLGASYITTEFIGSIGKNWSLKLPVIPPTDDPNFCLAIRWINNNISPIPVVRYKLWKDVGEDLDYPLYGGETIPSNFVLEIWSSINGDYTSLLEDYFLITSILTPSTICCGETPPIYELEEYCELFTPLPTAIPIIFNDCYNNLPPFIFEEDDILINNQDDYVTNANGEVITWNSL